MTTSPAQWEAYYAERRRKCEASRRSHKRRRDALLADMAYGDGRSNKVDGRRYCKACGDPCPPRRRSFCSGGGVALTYERGERRGYLTIRESTWNRWGCVEEWSVRNDPKFLRAVVFARDRGVCAGCGLDCLASARPWQADHVEPLHRGGSGALDNVQTLCEPCHEEKSAAERRASRAC